MIRAAAVIFALFTAVTAFGQSPLFDPDDFLNPRVTGGRPVFISRLVIGAASNMSGDGFRPLGEQVGYVHLANSLSWHSFQFDYKRSQLKAEDGNAAVWRPITFNSPPIQPPTNVTPIVVGGGGVFLNTGSPQPVRNGTPKSKDTLNAAWYWPVGGGGGGIPVMLRTRLTFTRQPIETDLAISDSTTITQRLSGRERTLALDTDTWFRVAGHDVFGSLAVSETRTTGTLDDRTGTLADRKERALTYTNRFPSLPLHRLKLVIRPTLAVGGISNRGGSAVNLVNPAIEIFRPFARTGANLHVIYGPQWAANGGQWKTTHQVALFIDRALFVKVF